MELELAADLDAVAALSRLKSLTASRDGRSRNSSIKIVWHDSPEHALFGDGLALAEQRGVWRLERIYPGSATWLPGQPVPIVTEAPDRETLPSLLAPLAAFEGRQTTAVHLFDGHRVTITVAKGVLRAVTAERPMAHIWLSGEELAVRQAALLIAGAVPVKIPLVSLAAAGIALATGRQTAERHSGAPVLPEGTSRSGDALAHILGHLFDIIFAQADAFLRADRKPTEAVHQMRVAVRRARSALSIFRPTVPSGALDEVGTGLKQLGGLLGPNRDWDVFVDETAPEIRKAMPNDNRLGRLIAAAGRRRAECQKTLAIYLGSSAFRELSIELAWFAAAGFWRAPPVVANEADTLPSPALANSPSTALADSPSTALADSPSTALADSPPAALADLPPAALADSPSTALADSPPTALADSPSTALADSPPAVLADFAGQVLQNRWKKLMSAGKKIEELDIPSLHGVRLRAKRARYAAEMFASLHHGKAAHRFIRRLSALQQRLGVLNDGAVATHLLDELGGAGGRHAYATGLVTGFMAARAAKIRPRIVRAFRRFRRQNAYWT